MKHTYSRLCLKERWTLFIVCVVGGIVAAIFAGYAYTVQRNDWLLAGVLCAILLFAISGYIFWMNKRRREIKKEYSYEFDRELYAKERSCPKCGASIGSNVCFCPKCGTKFH